MPQFKHNDVEYDLVPTSEWTFRDALFAKHVSGGLSVVAIEEGVQQADPDAVIALMAVAIHRVRDTATPVKLREELEMGGPIVGFFDQITREDVGRVLESADPPAVAAETVAA